ncbi:YggS family pyridoxal phosphate-dependent enzyme [Virgibacillus oceani]
MDVAVNLANIKEQIRQACAKSNRNIEEITVIGVTKYVTIERTEEALQSGITNFGENRLEGFLTKYDHIGDRAKWHFIGTLQSRKVKDVIDKVDMIHSLDRMSLAKEINKRANQTMNCFVQVNVSGEESKHGLKPEEVVSFIEEVGKYEKIRIVGLMTMAPHIEDESRLKEIFRDLAALRDKARSQNFSHAPCKFLSMGMSNDFSLAIEAGATHIRIGSSLVGE